MNLYADKLGPLEKRVMLALWRRGSATVKEVNLYEGFHRPHSTLMTTMGRLYRKGILTRVWVDPLRSFRYTPLYTPAALEITLAVGRIKHLLASYGSLPLSLLVDLVAERDARLLDELSRMVEDKRKAMSGDKS
jgi:predicted transcriptional regulator